MIWLLEVLPTALSAALAGSQLSDAEHAGLWNLDKRRARRFRPSY
jgi:hypothetical protein